MKAWLNLLFILPALALSKISFSQAAIALNEKQQQLQFTSTINLVDAAINSINSLNSLIKKESYRNKIVSFNNPTNSDLGFNLENEIHTALNPILSKATKVSRQKFSSIISSILKNPLSEDLNKQGISEMGLFTPIISLVGNLVLTEKRVTREDLDSFMLTTSKYFAQYEKLGNANREFDNSMNKLKLRLHDIQFDLREFLIDLVTILNKDISRTSLRSSAFEDILIQHLNPAIMRKNFDTLPITLKYPTDGIKTSKEIVYNVQKLFTEYQKLYLDNYTITRNIVVQSRDLGKNIDPKKIENSLKELDQLFLESKDADVINIRLNTLSERLKALTICEQFVAARD